jgi:hypothetical protein
VGLLGCAAKRCASYMYADVCGMLLCVKFLKTMLPYLNNLRAT